VLAYPQPTSFPGPESGYFNDPEKLQRQRFVLERAGFYRLWDQVVAILRLQTPPRELLLKRQVQSIHESRNDAQHAVKPPSGEVVAEAVVNAQTFIDTLMQDAFGKALAEISLAHLVETPLLRACLTCAEQKLDAGQWVQSVGAARLAFELAQACVLARMQPMRFLSPNLPDEVGHKLLQEFSATGREGIIREAFIQVRDLLRLVHAEIGSLALEAGLGLNRQEYERFATLLPVIPMLLPNGTVEWLVIGQAAQSLISNLDRDASLWALEYTVDNVLRWEGEMNGPLTPPPVDLEAALQLLGAAVEA